MWRGGELGMNGVRTAQHCLRSLLPEHDEWHRNAKALGRTPDDIRVHSRRD